MPLWPQHAWGIRRSCAHGVEPGPGTTGASETSAAAPVCGNRRPVGLTCRLFPKRGFFMKFSGALSCEVADEAVVALVTLLPSSLKRRSIRSQHFTRLREARRRRPVRGARRCRGGVPRAPCPRALPRTRTDGGPGRLDVTALAPRFAERGGGAWGPRLLTPAPCSRWERSC